MKRDRMSIKQFNSICNDFHGITVNDVNYIGFMHTLLYTYVENSIFDEFCNRERETIKLLKNFELDVDELYNSLVDFC